MQVESIFDPATYTITYIVFDEKTKEAAIIDSVLDFDPIESSIAQTNINKAIKILNDNSLELKYIIDTHAHADHLTGAFILKQKYPNAKTVIGENIKLVQKTFKPVFNLKDLKVEGEQFDILLKEGESINIGDIKLEAIFTPGHTPACTSFFTGDAVFTGDSLFMPDFGTGRCDFPAGSADDLYNSIHEKLYKLPEDTVVYVGHDYGTGGRDFAWKTTIKESKEKNIQLKVGTPKKEFVEFRTKRDATLKEPKLIYQSIQVNIDAGKLPTQEDNGTSYLKMPLKMK